MKSIADTLKEITSLKLIAIVGLSSLALILTIKTPFFGSFWLDETITSWLTGREFKSLIHDAARLQAQSPLGFVFFWAWARLFGNSEIALRSLSIIASVITLFCTGYLGRRLSDYLVKANMFRKQFSNEIEGSSKGSWVETSPLICSILPVIFLLSNENFLRLAWTARPYALALAAFTGSLVMLTQWCSTRKLRHGAASFALLITAFYLHYLLILGSIAHIILVIKVVKPGLSLKQLLILGVTFAILCTPGLYHIYTWSKYRDVWHFLPSINLITSLLAFLPRQWFVYLPAVVIITWISAFPAGPFKRVSYVLPILGPLLGWCIIPTLGLITLSLILDQSFLGNRYLLAKEPGLALLVTALLFGVSSEKGQRIFLSIWLLFCCGLELSRQWRIEDWRQAALYLTELPADTTILLNTGLAELQSDTWVEAVRDFTGAEDYLISPLKQYGVNQKIFPISPPLNRKLTGISPQNQINSYELEQVLSGLAPQTGNLIDQPFILVTSYQKKLRMGSESELILKRLESFGFIPRLEVDLDQIRIYSLKKL